MDVLTIFLLFLFFFIVLPIILSGIRIVPEYQRIVVFRLGRFKAVKGPGVCYVVPIIDSVKARIDLRVRTTDIKRQICITKDNVHVEVDAFVVWRIVDPASCFLKVRDPEELIVAVAQGALRDIIGEIELDDLLAKREVIAVKLQEVLEEAVAGYGIKIVRTPIGDIRLPEELVRAIARAAEAERERRAKIIAAEGELQAAKILAETAKYYEKHPWLIRLRELETLLAVARERNTILLYPVTMGAGAQELLAALGLSLTKRQGEPKS